MPGRDTARVTRRVADRNFQQNMTEHTEHRATQPEAHAQAQAQAGEQARGQARARRQDMQMQQQELEQETQLKKMHEQPREESRGQVHSPTQAREQSRARQQHSQQPLQQRQQLQQQGLGQETQLKRMHEDEQPCEESRGLIHSSTRAQAQEGERARGLARARRQDMQMQQQELEQETQLKKMHEQPREESRGLVHSSTRAQAQARERTRGQARAHLQQLQRAQQQEQEQQRQPEQAHEQPREKSCELVQSQATARVQAREEQQPQQGPPRPTPMRLRGGGRSKRPITSVRDDGDGGGDESGGGRAGNGGAGRKRRGRGAIARRKESRTDKQAEYAARGTAAQQPVPTGQAMEARDRQAGHAEDHSQLRATAARPGEHSSYLTSDGEDALARGSSPSLGLLPTLPHTGAGTGALTEGGPARGRAEHRQQEGMATEAPARMAAGARAGDDALDGRSSHASRKRPAGSPTCTGTSAASRAAAPARLRQPRTVTTAEEQANNARTAPRAAERALAVSADNPTLASAVSDAFAAQSALILAQAAADEAAAEVTAIAAWADDAKRKLDAANRKRADEEARAAVQEIKARALAAMAGAGASTPCMTQRRATPVPPTNQDAHAEEGYARPRTADAVEWFIAMTSRWEAEVEGAS